MNDIKKIQDAVQFNEAMKNAAEEIRKSAPEGLLLTAYGERLVFKTPAGEKVAAPLSIIPFEKEKLPDKQHEAMAAIYAASAQIHNMEKREVPLTVSEVTSDKTSGGVFDEPLNKKDIAELVSLRLLNTKLAFLRNAISGKKAGSRKIVYLTARGRGYVNAHIDKEFMNASELQRSSGNSGERPKIIL